MNQDGSIVIRVVRDRGERRPGEKGEAAVPLPELPEGEIRGVVFSRSWSPDGFLCEWGPFSR